MEVFRPHSTKQDALIHSDAELSIGATGTQWGKSVSAALWMKRQIHRYCDPTDNFLLMAPTYKVMNQSMLPYFLRVMEGLGTHRKADGEFQLHGGGIVYCRTGTDANSIVGIPKTRAFWLDEAGLATLYFWENIQARAASVGAVGLLTTSPYSRNWIYRNLIKPIQAGLIQNIPLISASSWENPYHSLHDSDKRAQMRATMDARRFDMLFGGEWGQMAGLVYDCFDEAQNVVDPFPLPILTEYHAGVDWGYNPDPFVCTVRGITPDGNHYRVGEFYKTGMTINDMADYCVKVKRVYGIKTFWCDPSQPGSIEEFRRRGLNAQPSDNDIHRGIGLHYELIKTRKFKIFRGTSPHTLDELETYHYPELEDLGPDDDQKVQNPVGQNDHCLDTDRYVTLMTYRSRLKRTPYVPHTNSRTVENPEQRLKRLMTPKSQRREYRESDE